MAKIKGKQIHDDSVDLDKLRAGSKLLPDTATLGSSKTVEQITDNNEFVTKEYVDTQIETGIDFGYTENHKMTVSDSSSGKPIQFDSVQVNGSNFGLELIGSTSGDGFGGRLTMTDSTLDRSSILEFSEIQSYTMNNIDKYDLNSMVVDNDTIMLSGRLQTFGAFSQRSIIYSIDGGVSYREYVIKDADPNPSDNGYNYKMNKTILNDPYYHAFYRRLNGELVEIHTQSNGKTWFKQVLEIPYDGNIYAGSHIELDAEDEHYFITSSTLTFNIISRNTGAIKDSYSFDLGETFDDYEIMNIKRLSNGNFWLQGRANATTINFISLSTDLGVTWTTTTYSSAIRLYEYDSSNIIICNHNNLSTNEFTFNITNDNITTTPILSSKTFNVNDGYYGFSFSEGKFLYGQRVGNDFIMNIVEDPINSDISTEIQTFKDIDGVLFDSMVLDKTFPNKLYVAAHRYFTTFAFLTYNSIISMDLNKTNSNGLKILDGNDLGMITNLALPKSNNDAVNKEYVDLNISSAIGSLTLTEGDGINISDSEISLDISDYNSDLDIAFTSTENVSLNGQVIDLSSTGANLHLNGGGTYTDVAGTNGGLKYADDYSTSFTERSIVDKAYVDGKTSELVTEKVWLELTGYEMSTTGEYLGLFEFPSTAVVDADVYVNGVKLSLGDYYFDTIGNYKPTVDSVLYFVVEELPYIITAEDEINIVISTTETGGTSGGGAVDLSSYATISYVDSAISANTSGGGVINYSGSNGLVVNNTTHNISFDTTITPNNINLTGDIILADGKYIGSADNTIYLNSTDDMYIRSSHAIHLEKMEDATIVCKVSLDGSNGLVYADDYTFTERSLVDKAYVDAAILASSTSGTSGTSLNWVTEEFNNRTLSISRIQAINNANNMVYLSDDGKMSIQAYYTRDGGIAIGDGDDLATPGMELRSNNSPITLTSGTLYSVSMLGEAGLLYHSGFAHFFTDNSLITKRYVDYLFESLVANNVGISGPTPHPDFGYDTSNPLPPIEP